MYVYVPFYLFYHLPKSPLDKVGTSSKMKIGHEYKTMATAILQI